MGYKCFDEVLNVAPYSLAKKEKKSLLNERLRYLSAFHYENCDEYKCIVDAIDSNGFDSLDYSDLPFLPVRLFKELELKSVSDDEIIKTMTSSGTSGQKTSKIYLDRTTSSNQQKAMVKIVSDFTGSSRMPMIIVDCPSVVKNRAMFSARGAGILGFSMFGTKKIYALDDDMRLDVSGILDFLDAHKGERILLFGFTFMIWQYFYKELLTLKEQGIALDLSNAVMIHGGGWKKLISESVSTKEFHDSLYEVCGLNAIHDYYGMVEQTGCIYMQCECGHLHASIFSDVITRRHKDFSVCDIGEPGIIQVVSTIPESYPGHSLLTEDEGVILGEDDCPCGRKGKYFEIHGRIKNAEIRGCSDTFAAGVTTSDIADCADTNLAEDAVFTKMSILLGDKSVIVNASKARPKPIFDARIVDFCNDVSKQLMGSVVAKSFPDVVTLGFWLRRASVKKMCEEYMKPAIDKKKICQIGRGVAFHIAPSNVPVNFAYSLFSGLLTGNINIVKVPSKKFPQIDVICDALNTVLRDYDDIKPYITLVRYDRDRVVNDYLSQICDMRIIWGGDNTIAELRKSKIGPRSKEITFADRYSIALINADSYLESDDYDGIAQRFYNDTYLSDQNACTSPRVVIWSGAQEHIFEAKKMFWLKLHEISVAKYDIQPVQCIDKYSTTCISSIKCSNLGPHVIPTVDNIITRIQVDTLDELLMDYRCNSGLFYEYDMNSLDELYNICNNVHCQTVSIIGDTNMLEPLISMGVKGVDRIVPMGHTMDFGLYWDGYDLVDELTRKIVM